MADYPGALKSFDPQTDGVSTIDAKDVNEAYNEIEAMQADQGIYAKDQRAASYIVFKIGSTYYAMATFNGGTHYSGSVFDVVINSAIGDLPTLGGEVKVKAGEYAVTNQIFPPNGKAFILSGEGRNSTILKLADSTNELMIQGFFASPMVVLQNMGFDGNKANQSSYNHAVYIASAVDYFLMDNCLVKNAGVSGLIFYNAISELAEVRNSLFLDNGNTTGGGISVDADSTPEQLLKSIKIFGGYYNGNKQSGMNLNRLTEGEVVGARSYGNGQNGIDVALCSDVKVIGGHYEENEGTGAAEGNGVLFFQSDHCVVVGATCKNNNNTDSDAAGVFFDQSNYCTAEACMCYDDQGSPTQDYGIKESNTGADNNLIINNQVSGNVTEQIKKVGVSTVSKGNHGASLVEESDVAYMKNTSGGALAAGDVVILKSVAAGNEVTTTTTSGDDSVLGVTVSGISNNAFGNYQTIGKNTDVKVNGVGDIAVGDFLVAHTDAGIAMKGESGGMAFAKALEAYSTDNSSGVIDALLITPRKI